jgi:hypothetical protein
MYSFSSLFKQKIEILFFLIMSSILAQFKSRFKLIQTYYKMPCQMCKSSTHTLTGCTADISMYTDAIKNYMETSSFALRHQYQAINQFPKPVLAVMCYRLGYSCSLSKPQLIKNIIIHYFIPLFNIDPIVMQVASEHLRAEVGEAYRNLQMWNIDDQPDMVHFRDTMLSLLETYHRRAFGLSYSQQLMNDIIGGNGFTTLTPIVPVVQQAHRSSKAHLKKLKIKVKVDAKLKAQDCFMCCDEDKPIARLGCSHEYCMDCVVKCAKVRTKSFIVCAMCRVEIAEVHVSNNVLKKTFAAQLKKE